MTFDLEAARQLQEDLSDEPDESVGGNPCAYRKKLMGMLPAALDEVERLRHDVDGLTTALAASGKTIIIGSKEQATRIAELESEIKSLEEHRRFELATYNRSIDEWERRVAEKVRQIEALKAGWKDDRAARIFYETYPGISDLYSWRGYPEDACQMRPKRYIRDDARRQLAAEHPDLFGPEDKSAKPAKIVLTEEQRAALELVCDLADGYECKYAFTAAEQSKALDIARALLQEARP